MKASNHKPLMIAAATVSIWVGFLVFARLGVKQSLTPWDLIFLRFAFASLVALGIMVWRKTQGQPAWGQLRGMRAWSTGIFAGLGFTCIAFIGYGFAPAAHGAVLMPGTLPFWTAIFGAIVLGDRIAGRKLLGLILIMLGVACMAWQAISAPHGVEGAWRGDVLFPLASASWAVYVINARRWGIAPLDAIVVTPLVALALYAPFYLIFAPKMLHAVPMLTILAHGAFQGCIALALSMWLFGRMVQIYGPVRTTMITALAPPIAALVAVPLLDEPLTRWVVLGLVGVVMGTIIGVRPASAPPAPATAQSPAA